MLAWLPISRTRSCAALAAALALGFVSHALGQSVSTPAPSNSRSTSPQRLREIFPVQERREWRFEESGCSVLFDNTFSGARVNACERIGPFDYKIVTSPENLPINPSPWYAFRVRQEVAGASEVVASSAAAPREIVVRIVVASSKSRPWPRVSVDGGPFERVSRDRYRDDDGSKEGVVRLTLADKPIFIAANDMIGIGEIEGWTDGLASQLGVEPREIGRSRAGRSIRAMEFGAKDASDGIVIIGRQHPPEVAGTVGLMRFVETLAAETPLAREFRARFRVLCVPLVNPDGVHEGHWRSTLGHVDANRDWHDFTEPETEAVRAAILSFAKAPNMRVCVLLDFHATNKDIFYVPPDGAQLWPPHFARDWLAAIARRFPNDAVESSATNNVDEWTFKRWAFETFAAPGITYELGSATPHEKIGVIVPGAAEEAMQLLLSAVAEHAGHAKTGGTQPPPAQSTPQSTPRSTTRSTTPPTKPITR
jgi:predicted deacylase